jgi:flagellar biosynthesis/type III secretory pathway protein FliH
MLAHQKRAPDLITDGMCR